jgi:hypothetical protein
VDRGTRVVPGRLRITGRRINGPAPPLRAHVPSGYGEGARLQASGLIFKTQGCWRVTGRVGRTTLTFVTRGGEVAVSVKENA